MKKPKAVPQKLVLEIIRNRRNASLGFGLAWLVLVAMFVYGLHYLKAGTQVIDTSIEAGLIIFFGVFGTLFSINAYYYRTGKYTYRIWNKLIYIYFVRLFIFIEILNFIFSLMGLFSTKSEDGFTRAGKGVQLGLSASTAYLVYKDMTSAQLVDAYYKQLPPGRR